MEKRKNSPSKKDNINYIKQRRNHMLSMGFCPECSRYNDLFPAKCCSRCSEGKHARYASGK